MKKKLLGLSAAVVLACSVGSVSANAFTESASTSVTGLPCNVGTCNVDVLAGASYNADFVDLDAAGTLSFSLDNTNAVDIVVTVLTTTVNQLGSAAFFTGGATVDFGPGGPADVAIAQGVGYNSGVLSFLIAAGSAVTMDFIYGAVSATGLAGTDFDFTVSATPIPIPAPLALLLSALFGLGFLGRFKRNRVASA